MVLVGRHMKGLTIVVNGWLGFHWELFNHEIWLVQLPGVSLGFPYKKLVILQLVTVFRSAEGHWYLVSIDCCRCHVLRIVCFLQQHIVFST